MEIRLVNKNIKANFAEELLKERGITNIPLFLKPTAACLQDPSAFENIEKGKVLLEKKAGGPICIIVDSDNDGFTSAAIIYTYITRAYPNTEIDFLLHEGKQHGLEDHIDNLCDSDKRYSLIICPDSSSNDYEHHERLKQIETPVLVLDHHEAEAPFSDNAVIINNQLSPYYLNKELTGAGVAWQFCRYLDMKNKTSFADDLIDLAAWGVVGDMGSTLEYENRYIVDYGLSHITNFFFKALCDKQSFSMGGKINHGTVAFYIVPLINAMIRVGSLPEKERLFLAYVKGDEKIPSGKRGAKGELELRAVESARECTNARSKQNKIRDQFVDQLEIKIFNNELDKHKVLLVELDEDMDYPPELNGLAAMILTEKYKKPVLLGRPNPEGEIKGSMRNPNNSPIPNLKDFLGAMSYFTFVEGHQSAAGFGIYDTEVERFLKTSDKLLEDVDFGESYFDVNFDRIAADQDIRDIVMDCGRLEDVWGQKNPSPVIHVEGINIKASDIKIMGKNQDTVKWEKNGVTYIKFFAKDLIKELQAYTGEIQIEIVGKMAINNWMGNETPQILISECEHHAGGHLSF